MSARRALLLVLAVQLPVWAIIGAGFLTDHVAAAIFVVVGLIALGGFAVTTMSIRRAKVRASKRS